jgi:hypothetical protein
MERLTEDFIDQLDPSRGPSAITSPGNNMSLNYVPKSFLNVA